MKLKRKYVFFTSRVSLDKTESMESICSLEKFRKKVINEYTRV